MYKKGRFVRRIVDSESDDDEVRCYENQAGVRENQEKPSNNLDSSSDDGDAMSGTEYDNNEEGSCKLSNVYFELGLIFYLPQK